MSNTDLLPEPVKIQIAERETALLNATAPKATKSLAAKQAELEAEMAGIEQERYATRAGISKISDLLFELGGHREELENLASIQESIAGAPVLAAGALRELLEFRARQDPYSQARFINSAREVSNLHAIGPAVPGAIAACQAAISKLQNEIRQTASATGVDLKKLLNHLRAECRDAVDQKLHVHFENGRLNLE